MNLTQLYRQTVTWQKQTGENTRSERTYGAAVKIPAAVVAKQRDIFTSSGETVTTARQVTMRTEPTVGDLLAGREVIQVDTVVDYTGSIVGYRALTR